MKIYPINRTTVSNQPKFTSLYSKERRIDAGSQNEIPTLKDLYDLEDRLIEERRSLVWLERYKYAQLLKAQTQFILDNMDCEKPYIDNANFFKKLEEFERKKLH